MSIHLQDATDCENFLLAPFAVTIEEARNEAGNTFSIIAPLQAAASFLAVRFQLNQLIPLVGRMVPQQQTS